MPVGGYVVTGGDGELLPVLLATLKQGERKESYRRLRIPGTMQVVLQQGVLPVQGLGVVVVAISLFSDGECDEFCLRPLHQSDGLSLVLPSLGVAKDATYDRHLSASVRVLAAEGVQILLLFSNLVCMGGDKINLLDAPVRHSLL